MKWQFKVNTRVVVPGRPIHTFLAKPYPSKLPLAGGYWVLFNDLDGGGGSEETWELDWVANAREVYEVPRGVRVTDEYLEKWKSKEGYTEGRLLGLKSDRTIRWTWTSAGEIPPYKERGLTSEQIDARRTVAFIDSHFTYHHQATKSWSLGTFLTLPDVRDLMSTPHVLADYLEEKCGDQACQDWYGFVLALRSVVG